jgi:CheY-like chemotaxis protein
MTSKPDEGSCFYFSIFCEIINSKIIPGIEPNMNEKNKLLKETLKILIVEDDEICEMLTVRLLNANNNEILLARDGMKAIESCSLHPDIDLILMDMKMPFMDGYEATKQIRQFNKDVIIIAQTAFALIGDREKAIDAGCNDYITKPFSRDLLISLIEKHLKNKNDGR